MGTRGLFGIYNGRTTKAAYNHYDSYPEHLGVGMKKLISETSNDDLAKIFKNIILIKRDSKPTKEQIQKCLDKKTFDGNVSDQSTDDWYYLLRNAQGDLGYYKDEPFFMVDDLSFIEDSLFCEWAYIINLKTKRLEIYQGFQKTANKSRYSKGFKPAADICGNIYYPCKMIKSFPLDELRKMTNNKFTAEIAKKTKED